MQVLVSLEARNVQSSEDGIIGGYDLPDVDVGN